MTEPEDFIVQFADRAPDAAEVLDVACARGRHSLFFARCGASVVALDESSDRLRSLEDVSRLEDLAVTAIQADVEKMCLLPDRFDVIVNTLFLWRPLMDQYVLAVRPGGVIYFRTFTTDHSDLLGHRHPRRDFQLERGELRWAFRELELIHYEEAIRDDRALATLVAMRGSL